MDKVWKILSVLIPFIGAIPQFFLDLNKRIIVVRSAERDVGKFGGVFHRILTWPYRFFFFFLCAIWIAALIALIGGFMNLVLEISPNGDFYVDWPILLFNKSLGILIVFVLLVVVEVTSAITKGLLLLQSGKTSSWRHDPGWINAFWYLYYGKRFEPFNTDIDACEAVANNVFRTISRGEVDYGQDRAEYADGLSENELANYWLIGNIIEDEIHRLGIGGSVSFSEVWGAVKKASAHAEGPFKPNFFLNAIESSTALYPMIRGFADPLSQALPNEPKISERVDAVVEELVKSYQGDAYQLPKSWRRYGPSVKVLWSRLQEFGLSEGIAAQFIKLAKWSRLWPEMDVGPFLYPYSQNLARLLLNLQCIRTPPNSTTISVDDNFRRLVAWTEDKIVKAVEKYFRISRDPETKAFCESKFGCQIDKLRREDLIREVDYFLWSQARDSTGLFGEKGQMPWHTEGRDRLTKKG